MTTTPRTWVVGEVVSAAEMNAEIRDQWNDVLAAWTSYTPTWTAATTNPAIGNGTITGRYKQIGKLCTASFQLSAGSTTTFGAGAYTIGLPVIAANSVVGFLGVARLTGTDTWIGQISIGAGGSGGNVTFPASSTNTRGANASATSPETWIATSVLRGTVTYQTV